MSDDNCDGISFATAGPPLVDILGMLCSLEHVCTGNSTACPTLRPPITANSERKTRLYFSATVDASREL